MLNYSFNFYVQAATIDIFTLLLTNMLPEIVWVLTNDFGNICPLLIAWSVILEDTRALFFARADITMNVNRFIYQHFYALALTHVVHWWTKVVRGAMFKEIITRLIEP